jgi:3-deoxy-manno-octulosonate cytidylyltransferase (CMP-KDO synthetase)
MIGSRKIACIIPARLKSTRFPRKVLSLLKGKPLLQWIWEAASRCPQFDCVAFAVDAEETRQLVLAFGGTVLMTSEACASGTDRLVELMQTGQVAADIWVNWQGDEPFIHKAMIDDLLRSCLQEESDIWTLKRRIVSIHDYYSPQVAKVVCDARDFALYFSRSPIPCYRDPRPDEDKIAYKHVGLYAYTTEALKKIAALSLSPHEEAEQLEQLRFLHHNLKIKVHDTEHEVFGIDLPEHLTRAETLIQNSTAPGVEELL